MTSPSSSSLHSDLPPLSRKPEDDVPGELTEHKIERYYLKRILNGEIPPGTRFPSNRELASQWGTSCSTVQRALNQLEVAGLIDRMRRKGTFVRPKTTRSFVGILFGPSLIKEIASHYRLLNAALTEQLDSPFLACRSYDNLGTASPEVLDSVLSHLRMDQRSFDFKGYICITAQPDSVPLDELLPPDTPRAISDPVLEGNDVLFDIADFSMQTAIALHAEGARQFCWIGNSRNDFQTSGLIETAQELGIPAPEICLTNLGAQSDHETASYHHTLSLIDDWRRRGSFPEALIVPDDIAARGVVFALMARGIEVPKKVRLAVLGNEGADIFYPVPVLRYNYPIKAVSLHLAETLKDRMSGAAIASCSSPKTIKGSLLS